MDMIEDEQIMGKIGEHLYCGKCSSSIEYASQRPHQLQYLGMDKKAYCEISFCEISCLHSAIPSTLG